MKTHHDLDVWKDSLDLCESIYLETENFPKKENNGLVSQMRRAAVSVSSNIAEGAARSSDKDFLRFLHYSMGSVSELETHIILATRMKFVQDNQLLLTELYSVKKLLSGLINYIKRRIEKK